MAEFNIHEKLPTIPKLVEVMKVVEAAFITLSEGQDYRDGMRMVAPGVDKLYGVKVPQLRKLSKGILKKYGKTMDPILEIADSCWSTGSREHELLALFLLAGTRLSPSERWDVGVRYLPNVNNWESCDQLCMALLGQALAEDSQYMDELEGWVEDENQWVRRAALVAPVYLRRATFSSSLAQRLDQRTLRLAEKLLNDPEKYIRKAVDWTVREVIKRHYDLGFEWLKVRAEANPSKVARSTLRLASKKLAPSDQKQFLALLG